MSAIFFQINPLHKISGGVHSGTQLSNTNITLLNQINFIHDFPINMISQHQHEGRRPIQVGDKVVIKGLSSNAGHVLNGRTGTVMEFLPFEEVRWSVKLDNEKEKSGPTGCSGQTYSNVTDGMKQTIGTIVSVRCQNLEVIMTKPVVVSIRVVHQNEAEWRELYDGTNGKEQLVVLDQDEDGGGGQCALCFLESPLGGFDREIILSNAFYLGIDSSDIPKCFLDGNCIETMMRDAAMMPET